MSFISAAGVVVTWPWFLGFMAFIVGSLGVLFWLGIEYERHGPAPETDAKYRAAIWNNGYEAGRRDFQLEYGHDYGQGQNQVPGRGGSDDGGAVDTMVVDEADQWIGELHGQAPTHGWEPSALRIIYDHATDPNDSLAERLTSTGELSMLTAQLTAATFLEGLDDWAARTMADLRLNLGASS